MKKEILFEMKSLYRDSFRITGYRFGSGSNAVAIVGALRGDEIQQQYICARMVSELQRMESEGLLADDCSLLVIPSCNPFSMNVKRRFWVMDGTDINRMFPGYDRGETTQRIAAALFHHLQGFKYGIQLSSFYVPGHFVPHIRLFHTGYEDIKAASMFGLPFVSIRNPLPFDTTLLNYNWQIWDTKAFSLYSGHTAYIDHATSEQALTAIKRFLYKSGVSLERVQGPGYESEVFNEDCLLTIKSTSAGFFIPLRKAGEEVNGGDVLANIVSPLDGSIIEEIRAPESGTLFFSHNHPHALGHAPVYKLLPSSSKYHLEYST